MGTNEMTEIRKKVNKVNNLLKDYDRMKATRNAVERFSEKEDKPLPQHFYNNLIATMEKCKNELEKMFVKN